MDPAKDDRPGVECTLAMVPRPGRTRTRPGLRPGSLGACRWCARPAAWSWTLTADAATEPGERLLGEECRVCEGCQALTLAGDDAALLDRATAVIAARVPFPYAAAFVREQEAARLAHWIARRTTFRPC